MSVLGLLSLIPTLLLADVTAGVSPTPVWTVSDDTLSVPMGTIADVAVGADDVVYLLDTQNILVRRIDRGGRELAPLGRSGEGPGEFTHPRLVAVAPDDRCVVIQDFHARATCLTPTGDVCAPPDVSIIRNGFLSTVFMGTARIDTRGRLVVMAVTTPRAADDSSMFAAWKLALSVFRFGPTDTAPTVLFSDSPDVGGTATVRPSVPGGFFMARGWDVDDDGTVIYADPAGRYRVLIGHPADGPSRTIDLPAAPSDASALRAVAKSAGRRVENLPRIASVHWLDGGWFLVEPGAAATAPKPGLVGTFEAFDARGRSHGRKVVHCDYDPARDALFIRRGMLVVINGGRSAMEASLKQMGALIGRHVDAPPASAGAPDVIRISLYDLGAIFTDR